MGMVTSCPSVLKSIDLPETPSIKPGVPLRVGINHDFGIWPLLRIDKQLKVFLGGVADAIGHIADRRVNAILRVGIGVLRTVLKGAVAEEHHW